MVSVYMPDERISMFPYTLSTELLSLGAGLDSYALSCGVTLDELGVCVCVSLCVCSSGLGEGRYIGVFVSSCIM